MSTEKINDSVTLSSEIRLAIFLLGIIGILGYLNTFIKKPVPLSPKIPVVVSLNALSSKEIMHGNILEKKVIFTFDGGDGTQSTRKILEVLAKHRVRSSFFLTGKFVESNQDLSRSIALLGHEIYSHTYSHPHLPLLTDKEISAEFMRTERIFKKVIGISPKPYFRAPYGDRDERVLVDAFRSGYQSVYWTIDALDWQENSGRNADEVKNTILNNLAPGNIYLMHLGDNITGSILDEVFTVIESKGYRIVSLKEGII